MLKYENIKAMTALFMAAVIIGLVPIFVRFTELDPSASAFWRMFLSSIFLAAIWCCKRGIMHGKAQVKSKKIIVLVGIYFALDLIFLHLSLAYATVATASLLNNLAPIFSGIILMFSGIYLGVRYWVGVVVSICGVYLLLGNIYFSDDVGFPVGAVAGVISAVFFALYLQALQTARQAWSTGIVLLGSGIAASFVLAPVALIFEVDLIPHTLESWGAVIALAIVCQLLGQACLVYSSAHLPSMTVANGMLCQTIFATIFAVFLFGETLSFLQVTGVFVTILGVSIVLFGKKGIKIQAQSSDMAEHV